MICFSNKRGQLVFLAGFPFFVSLHFRCQDHFVFANITIELKRLKENSDHIKTGKEISL